MLDQVILRARAQVGDLALALGQKSLSQIGASGLPPLRDEFGDAGPLGGLHAAMKWAKPQADYIATFACDTPCFPDDMVARLVQAAATNPAGIALPQGHGRVHTALGVWSTTLLAEIERAITAGELAFTRWAIESGAVLVEFPQTTGIDFFNINTPDDAQRYREWLGT